MAGGRLPRQGKGPPVKNDAKATRQRRGRFQGCARQNDLREVKGRGAFLNLVGHYESVRVFSVNAGVQGDGVEQPSPG